MSDRVQHGEVRCLAMQYHIDRACASEVEVMSSEVESLRSREMELSAVHESEAARLSEERSHLEVERSLFHQQELSLDSAVYNAQIASLSEDAMAATGVARDAAESLCASQYGIPCGLVPRLVEAAEVIYLSPTQEHVRPNHFLGGIPTPVDQPLTQDVAGLANLDEAQEAADPFASPKPRRKRVPMSSPSTADRQLEASPVTRAHRSDPPGKKQAVVVTQVDPLDATQSPVGVSVSAALFAAAVPQLPMGVDGSSMHRADTGSPAPRSKSRSPREHELLQGKQPARATRSSVAAAQGVLHHGLLGGPGGLCPQPAEAPVAFADFASLPCRPSPAAPPVLGDIAELHK